MFAYICLNFEAVQDPWWCGEVRVQGEGRRARQPIPLVVYSSLYPPPELEVGFQPTPFGGVGGFSDHTDLPALVCDPGFNWRHCPY